MKHRWLTCQNILLKNNLAQMARFLKRRISKDKGEHSEPSRRFRCGDKIGRNDLVDFEKMRLWAQFLLMNQKVCLMSAPL
jgi:hypothetical protein